MPQQLSRADFERLYALASAARAHAREAVETARETRWNWETERGRRFVTPLPPDDGGHKAPA